MTKVKINLTDKQYDQLAGIAKRAGLTMGKVLSIGIEMYYGLQEDPSILKCSWCAKSQNDVEKIIAGPTTYICNQCVEICSEILADPDNPKWREGEGTDSTGMGAILNDVANSWKSKINSK